MTDKDYGEFVGKYRQLRLGEIDFGFVLAWRPKLNDFELPDLLAAVIDTAADARIDYPTNDLPLLIEHATERQSQRRRAATPRKAWGKKPLPPESWDRRMLALGAIDQDELERRQQARRSEK